MNLKNKIYRLPETPGIYLFLNKDNKIIYVGKSTNIKKRVSSYFIAKTLGPKTNLLKKQIADIKHIKVFSEFEALLLESQLIKEYQPFFNTAARDDKSPLYIKISNDEIPQVTVTRKSKETKKVFLRGPFENSKTTRKILKITRRIFPFCHHKNPKKPCLYVHLGLCPYPWSSQEAKGKYQDTVKKIEKFLSGRSKRLLIDLAIEMRHLSNQQKFEEAQIIKNQIQEIEKLHQTYHSPAEFLKQPTLVDDLIATRLYGLKNALGLKKIPRRIECYDISNIAGRQATGSMVVFENGEPLKREYRRFKIKFSQKPNDYEMIREVLTRRLKNKWPMPDLIIIDGGRGQLNVALSVLEKFKLSIPTVSLAKRLEEIYIPSQVLPISLPKESSAKQLALSIRNEAHRFAISYHQLLRSRKLLGQRI